VSRQPTQSTPERANNEGVVHVVAVGNPGSHGTVARNIYGWFDPLCGDR
jgi:hypothetical protein